MSDSTKILIIGYVLVNCMNWIYDTYTYMQSIVGLILYIALYLIGKYFPCKYVAWLIMGNIIIYFPLSWIIYNNVFTLEAIIHSLMYYYGYIIIVVGILIAVQSRIFR